MSTTTPSTYRVRRTSWRADSRTERPRWLGTSRTWKRGGRVVLPGKADEDQAYLAQHPLPDDDLSLVGLKINGHEVSYDGRSVVAWRLDSAGALIGFAGTQCQEITIDGRTTKFAEQRRADHRLSASAYCSSDTRRRRIPSDYRSSGHVSAAARIPSHFHQGLYRGCHTWQSWSRSHVACGRQRVDHRGRAPGRTPLAVGCPAVKAGCAAKRRDPGPRISALRE